MGRGGGGRIFLIAPFPSGPEEMSKKLGVSLRSNVAPLKCIIYFKPEIYDFSLYSVQSSWFTTSWKRRPLFSSLLTYRIDSFIVDWNWIFLVVFAVSVSGCVQFRRWLANCLRYSTTWNKNFVEEVAGFIRVTQVNSFVTFVTFNHVDLFRLVETCSLWLRLVLAIACKLFTLFDDLK